MNLIFFTCVVVGVSKLIGNTAVSIREFNHTQLEISSTTRGRYGRNVLAFYNETVRIQFIYSIINTLTVNTNLKCNFKIIDENHYPIPQLYNLMVLKLQISKNDFLKSNFNISTGFNYNNQSDLTEIYTYDYNTLNTSNEGFEVYYIERVELLSYYSFGGVFLFAIIIFITLCLLRKKQPILSRGITPFVHLGAQIVFLGAGFPSFITPLQYLAYNCLIVWFLQYSMLLLIFILTLLHFTKYISLLYIQIIKTSFLFELNPFTKFSRYNRCVKSLSSWKFNVIALIGFYFFFCVIFAIEFVVNKFKCDPVINRYIYNGIIALIASMACVILLYDILVHLRGKKIRFFLCSDQLFYRLEVYIFMVGAFVIFGTTSIIGFTIGFGGTLGSSIRNTIICMYIFLGQVIFPILITLHYQFKTCCKKKKDYIIDRIIKLDDFAEYCRKEFNDENLLCFNDIQKYKKEILLHQRALLAAKINQKYLIANCVFEVNTQSEIKQFISTDIGNNSFPTFLFDKLEHDVVENLADTISRYMATDRYIARLKNQNQMSESFGQLHKLETSFFDK